MWWFRLFIGAPHPRSPRPSSARPPPLPPSSALSPSLGPPSAGPPCQTSLRGNPSAGPPPPGFLTTARGPKRAHLSVPALQTPPKFHENPMPGKKKGLRGFRAIALLCVFSKLYTTVLVDLLHEEKDLIEWSLHVGGRERSQLRAHLADEYIAEALGVAERSPDRFGTRTRQIQDGLHGKREDPQWCRRYGHVGGSIGIDAGRPRFGLLRELSDGVLVFEVHPPRRSGGSSIVGSRGQIRVMESRGKGGTPKDGQRRMARGE